MGTNLLRLNCTTRGTWNRWWVCCDIRGSLTRKEKVRNEGKFRVQLKFQLTKNDRLHCEASPTCHKLSLPSPSAIPNLFPCCEKRHRVTVERQKLNVWTWKHENFHRFFTFRERARWSWRANCLLMSPLPHLHRSILTARQVQRHQRMGTHALYVVDFML